MVVRMGMQLLNMAEARAMGGGFKKISIRALHILWVMCKTARDIPTETEPAECYFRGWEHLAQQLGYEELTPPAKKAVMRALAELTQAGLIERDEYPNGNRRRTTYRIRL